MPRTSSPSSSSNYSYSSSSSSSLYPTSPPGSRVLIRIPATDCTTFDHVLVTISSLMIVGSVVWVPMVYAWLWRRLRQLPPHEIKRKRLYRTLLLVALAMFVVGPHRYRSVGQWLRIKKWRLWTAWMRFVAMEVILDAGTTTTKTNASTVSSSSLSQQRDNKTTFESSSSLLYKDQPAILAIIPHGIFPFALALSTLPETAARAFGEFRPVVATATALLPIVRGILAWIGAVDASRSSVHRALTDGARIGLAPGGIAEMFEGYPKPLTHPHDEYAIVRKGFLKLAWQHQIPVIPVYCFGATKMLRRLQLPHVVESISLLLRVSICILFGQWGLPIPFRQKLLYVMGNPIIPPPLDGNDGIDLQQQQQQVDDMHAKFCQELLRLFDAHKESYGWGRKTLRILQGSSSS